MILCRKKLLTMIIDIHTHKPFPAPRSLISVSPSQLPAEEFSADQEWSVGYHPWDNVSGRPYTDQERLALRDALARRDVAALGECGIDMVKGAPLFRQVLEFRWQAELASELVKPMIIHCVRAHDHIIGMHRELKPEIPWAIHGFRGKPTIARMFLKEEIWLSFGQEFNADSLRLMPRDRILCETDAADVQIEEVVSRIAAALGDSVEETRGMLERNAAVFLRGARR